MQGLIGETLLTPVDDEPNWIRGFEGSRVRVATRGNEDGALVSISLIQGTVDRVFEGVEVIFNPHNRSAFLGAVLRTMPQVEVLTGPRRARLRHGSAPSQTNPDWEFDELILALDLYLRWRPRQPPAGHPDLAALSDLLRRLQIHLEAARTDTFRNANSVRRKLGDFGAPDPDYLGASTRGGERVHLVWDQFADDPEALAVAVERLTATANGDAPTLPPEDDEGEAVEGRILFRQHRVRERDPGLVRTRKAAMIKAHGRLACEVCDLDFGERYGDLGTGFIEAHHTVSLAIGSIRVTRAADLALVCPNCHRMIHRARPMLTIEQLRERLLPRRDQG
jgi:5-methylcytosine-specific restriction protein A